MIKFQTKHIQLKNRNPYHPNSRFRIPYPLFVTSSHRTTSPPFAIRKHRVNTFVFVVLCSGQKQFNGWSSPHHHHQRNVVLCSGYDYDNENVYVCSKFIVVHCLHFTLFCIHHIRLIFLHFIICQPKENPNKLNFHTHSWIMKTYKPTTYPQIHIFSTFKCAKAHSKSKTKAFVSRWIYGFRCLVVIPSVIYYYPSIY